MLGMNPLFQYQSGKSSSGFPVNDMIPRTALITLLLVLLLEASSVFFQAVCRRCTRTILYGCHSQHLQPRVTIDPGNSVEPLRAQRIQQFRILEA